MKTKSLKTLALKKGTISNLELVNGGAAGAEQKEQAKAGGLSFFSQCAECMPPTSYTTLI
ncbi:hypothetical protein [Kordia sp.]|uniref:hypothetical protein n=1 Tax=Kordia sp. TaxID=1965332 RepID=UPI0025C31D97|nr:hypothetical protein [Kordia sp.]MCH2195476.1 hypothetical protein [Kordia sp.]